MISLCGLNQLWNLDKQISILHSQLPIKSNFATQKFSGQTCLLDSYRSQWRHGKSRVQIQFTMAVLPALNLSHVTGNAYCHHRGVLKGKSGSSDIQKKKQILPYITHIRAECSSTISSSFLALCRYLVA